MLLEALIAVLIFSFGVLAIVGLQAASIKNISDAKYRTEAAYLANEVIGILWANRTNIVAGYATPADWQNRVAATLPSGVGTVTVDTDPTLAPQLRATVTVRWTVPGNDQHTFVAVSQINGAGNI